MADELGISKDEAVEELAVVVEDAVNFIFSNFMQDWETAERYWDGGTDLPAEANRSSLVKTEVRDMIRAILPNVMRILLQSRKPVEYIPSSIKSAALVDQQSYFINQHFYATGGYLTLYSAVLESLKNKIGPVKVFWESNPEPEHISVTGISAEELVEYLNDPLLTVDEYNQSPDGGINLKATKYHQNGRIRFEAFPAIEFFVTEGATNLEEYTHGHRRSVTVSEAIAMGLEYDDWSELDDEDPATNDGAGVAATSRGYNATPQPESEDVTQHRFLLSEVYCKYDMDGDGVPEKYCFYLGGTGYEYLHHEQVDDFCIELVQHDPQPFTVIGRSICDVLKPAQDTETAVLRTMVDNALMGNNPRPYGDPTKVNFQDLMNNAIGAPIKTVGDAKPGVFDTPFTTGQLLPFLQYLSVDAQEKVGVTKAARGLDPDALQSTDKAAVLNTIELSQGQLELMVRNIVETALVPLFRKTLKLSIAHMSPIQMLKLKGVVVPVDISKFDPNLLAMPNVGLGTTSPQQRLQMLGFVYQEQKQYMAQFGLDNPFTSLSQVYNTIEDMVELGGLPNVGRYFNYIDRDAEKIIAAKIAEAMAKQAEEAAKNAPIDPSKVLMATESMRTRIKNLEIATNARTEEMRLSLEAMTKAEEMDFKRDELSQNRRIELTRIGKDTVNAAIVREQEASKPARPANSTSADGPKPKRLV